MAHPVANKIVDSDLGEVTHAETNTLDDSQTNNHFSILFQGNVVLPAVPGDPARGRPAFPPMLGSVFAVHKPCGLSVAQVRECINSGHNNTHKVEGWSTDQSNDSQVIAPPVSQTENIQVPSSSSSSSPVSPSLNWGTVHRIDKHVTGVLVGSFHPDTRSHLTWLIRKHKTSKTYLALCNGLIQTQDFSASDGKRVQDQTLSLKVLRTDSHAVEATQQESSNILVISSSLGGQPSRSILKVLQHVDLADVKGGECSENTAQKKWHNSGNKLSVVLLRPLTGRFHQLRKHMHAIGHDILVSGNFANKSVYLHALQYKFHGVGVPDNAESFDLADSSNIQSTLTITADLPSWIRSVDTTNSLAAKILSILDEFEIDCTNVFDAPDVI